MHFRDCNLYVIKANAFDAPGLHELRSLVIHSITHITFHTGALNALRQLSHFELDNSTVRSDYELFAPVATTLRSILLNACTNTNLFNFLAPIRLYQIMAVYISMVQNIQTVTPNTISNMPNIRTLRMSSCGIETITNDAFAHPDLRRLTILRMDDNRLKTLPAKLFAKIGIAFARHFFEGNPWECTCDIMVLGALYRDAFGYVCYDSDRMPNCTMQSDRNETQLTTGIVSQRCYHHYGTNLLRVNFTTVYYLRFNRTLNRIYIRGSNRLTFKLVFMCNRVVADCQFATAKYAAFTLSDLLPGIYIVCAIDSRTKQTVWPLNCATIRLHYGDNHGWISMANRNSVICVFICINIFGFVIAIILGIWLVYHNLRWLRHNSRIVLQINLYTNQVELAYVMPKEWRKLQKIQWVNSMKLRPGKRGSFSSSLFDSSLDEQQFETDASDNHK